jgi:glycerol-3-phosphate acyltransferase PlsX
MAMSKLQLRMKAGVQRPAIASIWPSATGQCVVLDVGANLECDAVQLTEFGVLGEAYCRAISGKKTPTVGLLNVGSEDGKGTAIYKNAHKRFQELDFGLNYIGNVEGNDISKGRVDVVVTDGFTGNIALKTAEGTGRLIGGFVKEALDDNILGKLAKLVNAVAFKRLKMRIDPRNFNGGAFLGLNGIVVKSHGGTDHIGFANALNVAMSLAESNFNAEIESTLQRLHDAELEIETTTSEV